MVEVSNLYDLNIYTIAGEYVGKVADVVLNMRLGTIAKLQIMALEQENKEFSIKEFIDIILQKSPDDTELKGFKEGLFNVDFDKVTAVGDIMLIDPQDLGEQKPQEKEIAVS